MNAKSAKRPKKPRRGEGESGHSKPLLDIFWRDKSVRYRLGFALEHDSVYKDIEFLIGKEEVRIPAHKLILRLSSLVFENIIASHEVKGLTEIKLPNMTVPMFNRLLKFVYTDELQMHDLAQFLKVANDFGFTELPQQALQVIKNIEISPANSVYLLGLSMELGDRELEHYSLTYIHSNAVGVLEAEEFVCASYSVLCRLLKDDNLGADELTVFKAVMRWARYKCKLKNVSTSPEQIRKTLKGARMYVRYTQIPYDKILADVKDSGVLNTTEYVQVLKTFIDPSDNSLNLNVKPRNSIESPYSPLQEPVPQPQLQPAIHKSLPSLKVSPTMENTTLVAKRRIQQLAVSNTIPWDLPMSTQPSSLGIPPLMSIQTEPDPPPVIELQPWVHQIPPTDYQFIRNDYSVPFSQLLLEVFNQEMMHPVEEIILRNVSFLDSLNHTNPFVASGPVKVAENRVYLKNLKRFVFYQQKDYSSVLPDVTFKDGLSTKEFLFFETGPESSVPWTLKTLWNLGVNVCIDVKGIKLLEIDHAEHSLTLSFPINHEANEIIAGFDGSSKYPLKALCLTSCQILAETIPTDDLQVLILQGVNLKCSDSGSAYKAISPFRIANKCQFLTRISIFSPGGCQLSLGSDLARCRSVLQSMALSKVQIGGWTKKIMRDELIFKSLEEMYLDVCTWTNSFIEYFPIAFPSLQRIAIRSVDSCRVTATFLKKILSIKTLKRVAVFRYVCNDDTHYNPNLDIFTPPVKIASDKDEIHKLLISAGMTFVNATDVPDFILARDPTSSVGWKFIVDFHELDEAHFHCSLLGKFFADSDVSKSMGDATFL